jgi:hypothetical protein
MRKVLIFALVEIVEMAASSFYINIFFFFQEKYHGDMEPGDK